MLTRFLQRRRLERELDAELRDHLERRVADLVSSGVTEAEARRQARVEFGGLDQIKEQCRDARGTRWLEEGIQDVRYAVRLLRKTPAFTLVAVLSLALGIGANAALFSLVDAVLLKTLPVRAPDKLVLLAERNDSQQIMAFTSSRFETLRQSEALQGLCAFRPWPGFRLTTAASAELVMGQLVSGNCFSVLGVPALVGRTLTEDDDRNGMPVAVISHVFWHRHFAADPAIVGRTLELQGRAFTVVGVTPRGFHGMEAGRAIDISVPLSSQPVLMPGTRLLNSPTARWLRLLGRLAHGVPRDQAYADLQRLWLQTPDTNVESDPPPRLEVLSGSQGINDLRRQFSLPLRLLMLAVGLLLLLACANLASLLVARAQAREQEIGLRLALGAGRGRIVRQLLTESIVLAIGGGLLGLVFAYWSIDAIIAILSRGRLPIVLDVDPDFRLLTFTLGISLVTSLLFGALPALRTTQADLQPHLHTTRTIAGGQRFRYAALVGAQATLSLVLVTAAGLFVRSLAKLHDVDAGFQKGEVLLVGVRPGIGGYDKERARQLYADLYDRFSRLPGVRSVTLSMDTPLGGLSWSETIATSARPRRPDDPAVYFNFVGSRFFETMGIPLVSGRDFTGQDDSRAATAIISESVARRYFSNRTPPGEHLLIGDAPVEIVGVVKDVRYRSIRDDTQETVYRPYLQQPGSWEQLTFALRTDMDPKILTDVVRREVRALAPTVPLYSVSTLSAQFDGSIATERLLASLSGFFGGMALLLMAIGVYGTLTFAVSHRTRELGVRLALGAERRDIARLLLGGALGPVCVGLLVGLPVAFAATQVTQRALFGIASSDPVSYSAGAVLLVAVAAAAAWIPARRAARTDPMTTLRHE
jgi:predicted permease